VILKCNQTQMKSKYIVCISTRPISHPKCIYSGIRWTTWVLTVGIKRFKGKRAIGLLP